MEIGFVPWYETEDLKFLPCPNIKNLMNIKGNL